MGWLLEGFFEFALCIAVMRLEKTWTKDLSLAGTGRMLLVFGVLWSLYGAYARLTRQVPPRRAWQKLALVGGMAGSALAAWKVPDAFAGRGALFGAGYLLATCMLILWTQVDPLEADLRLNPYPHAGGALLILAAGFTQGAAAYALWAAAYLVTFVPSRASRDSWGEPGRSFHSSSSLLALGFLVPGFVVLGIPRNHSSPGFGAAILGYVLLHALGRAYFRDVKAAEAALAGVDTESRRLAIRADSFGHMALLLGLVGWAAGLEAVSAHPGDPAGWPAATAFAVGVALFLAGMAYLRRGLSIGSPALRLAAAAAVLASIPFGARSSFLLSLATADAAILGMQGIDGLRARAAATAEPAAEPVP